MTRPEYLSARECERQWRNTRSLVERTFRGRRARREPFVRYFGRTRFRLFYPPLRSTVFPPHFFPYQVLSKMNYSSYFYAVANARNFVLHHCFKYMHALYYWYILSLIRFLNKANIFTSTYISASVFILCPFRFLFRLLSFRSLPFAASYCSHSPLSRYPCCFDEACVCVPE